MTSYHEAGTKIQVYLRPGERDQLDRLTDLLATSKSDVLRRGMDALERQLTDPARHPALSVIGLIPSNRGSSAGQGYDIARDHDDCRAADEIAYWSPKQSKGSEVNPGSGGGE